MAVELSGASVAITQINEPSLRCFGWVIDLFVFFFDFPAFSFSSVVLLLPVVGSNSFAITLYQEKMQYIYNQKKDEKDKETKGKSKRK